MVAMSLSHWHYHFALRYVASQQEVLKMLLEDWVKALPVSTLRHIVADHSARWSVLWELARLELQGRTEEALAA